MGQDHHGGGGGVGPVDQQIGHHVGGLGTQVVIVHAVAEEGSVQGEGVGTGVVGDLGVVQLFKDGQLGAHHGVVSGGEDGLYLLADEGVHSGADLVGVGAGLFHIGDVVCIQIGLGLLNGLLGGVLGLGVQQANLLDVGVHGHHHIENHVGVQGIAHAGDIAAGGVHAAYQLGGNGVRHGGKDDGDALLGDHRLHDLGGGGGDGDHHVHAVVHQLGGDLVQGGAVSLAVEGVVGVVKVHAQLRALGIQLLLYLALDLVQGGVVHKFDDAHLILLPVPGLACAPGGAGRGDRPSGVVSAGTGGQRQGQRSGQSGRENLFDDVFHGDFLQYFIWRQMIGPCHRPGFRSMD